MRKLSQYILLILTISMLFILTSCGNDIKIEGSWYSEYANLYEFSSGSIFCENSNFTLENGERISGSYDECNGYIEAFIPSLGISESTPLYIVEIDGDLVVTDVPDASGRIYLYKNKSTAESVAQKVHQEFEEYQKEVDAKKRTVEKSIAKSKKVPITTDYDTVLLGELKKHTIAIEGIVTSYKHTEYSGYGDTYSFDVWFWSNKDNRYINYGLWTFDEDVHPNEIINKIKKLTDGDKVRIITEVYDDNSFGASQTTDVEIIEKVNLMDCGITIQDENIENFVEENGNASQERYVYIADIGTKYHSEHCRTLHESKNRVSYDDAIKMGKTPCNICNPMP